MSLILTLLADDYCVAQYPPDVQLAPPRGAPLWNLAVTADELSLLCETSVLPAGARRVEAGWRAFRFEGPFDFALTGILASVAVPLAQAGVGIFALSTFDTDYVLVKAAHLDAALFALRSAGHQVTG
jgi:uncharacterized protein